ncbi:hypothetical protein PVAP13_3NG162500 [Panicum virgatum]|uniref:Uncharacterized protein n=1 Tax=Panicum virgatum TaxID=38727 RepID=A0A8T0U8M3_PANVG|nr:hypothetical protein PVAP13_3NG162500 [Panicum virgatum]
METDDAAAKLRMTNDDAVEEVRLRSLRRRSWPIKQVMEDMRSGQWELRRKAYAYRRLKANAGLAEVDPWNLSPEFAMPKETRRSSLRTHSGYWEEKEDEFIAIRSKGGREVSSSASRSPSYQGVRRTLAWSFTITTAPRWTGSCTSTSISTTKCFSRQVGS